MKPGTPIRILWSLPIVVSLFSCVPAYTQSDDPKAPAAYQERLIMKFKEELTRDEIAVELESLQAQYHGVQINKVFLNDSSAEAIKARFPQRSKRIPANAVLPQLDRTYLMVWDEPQDVTVICQELLTRPTVEYAQPDHVAKTY